MDMFQKLERRVAEVGEKNSLGYFEEKVVCVEREQVHSPMRRWDKKASTCIRRTPISIPGLCSAMWPKMIFIPPMAIDGLDNIKKVGREHAQDKHGGTYM